MWGKGGKTSSSIRSLRLSLPLSGPGFPSQEVASLTPGVSMAGLVCVDLEGVGSPAVHIFLLFTRPGIDRFRHHLHYGAARTRHGDTRVHTGRLSLSFHRVLRAPPSDAPSAPLYGPRHHLFPSPAHAPLDNATQCFVVTVTKQVTLGQHDSPSNALL